jgi:putative ABC transport system substrate-binding protein
MERRAFLRTISSGLIPLPILARAQSATKPVIGFLCGESPDRWVRLVAAFGQGLKETGYVEGSNVTIDFRWAEGRDERLPAMAADLVRRQVAVLVATGGGNPVLAAKAATSTIPIVFTLGGDPVKLGVVTSLGRPGGNITGSWFRTADVTEKRLQLLHDLVPRASVVAMLMAPDNPSAEGVARQAQAAAHSLGLEIHVMKARTEKEIDAAFASLAQLRAGALLIGPDGFFFDRRAQITALAKRYAVPACYDLREFVEAGGLMSYGAYLPEVYREAGVYTGRILNGAKPADLPILQPSRVDLVINLKTAKMLGLTIPQSIQMRADELIQ